MHYIPESAREFLQEDPSADPSAEGTLRSFHYQSAPIYALTAAVGLLLGGDLLLGLIDVPEWTSYGKLFGFPLALLAAVLGGSRILYQTLENLFDGRVGADLALTIAALAAIVLGEHTTAALVVFVALCGESIEGFTIDRAQQAIRRIFNLCPSIAHVVREGNETDVPVSELVTTDIVVVRPGERIPVDGLVTEGSSAVDQSALTGESLPIDKEKGDEVFTGTLNQFGSLTVRAQKVGANTTLAQVIRLVAEAAERKAPLERTADRLARLFLPAVLLIAAGTLIGWRIYNGDWSRETFYPALAVLVVACPCPLILATPTAVMAAMAWLARTGVVVKGSVALERLAKVDTFAFDKTGTLTTGELTLGDVHSVCDLDERELLRVAAIAERRSEHLLARLVVSEAESRGCVLPPADEFEARPGSGVVARVRATVLGNWAVDAESDLEPHEQQRTVVVGNRRLLESEEISLGEEIAGRLEEMDAAGQSVLLVAVDGEVLGAIGVRDSVRAESRDVIAELKAEGIESFHLLTGDRKQPATNVADTLGSLDTVEAEMLPSDKARWIEEQTKAGRHVAMVGDGVNDAPALASATVGLALGGVGSDIAAEAGDLVLMGDPLRPLPGLLRLSRQLVRNIHQSIVLFAFGMNGLGIVLSAAGILSPVGSAVFHEFASLAVMLNALRLLWFERWDVTWLGRLSQRTAVAAEACANLFSPSRLTFRVLDNWRMLLRLTAAGVAMYWFAVGLVLIEADEEAVVTRFGQFETKLKPGLYWRWPPPFEQIAREKTGLVRTVQIGFRSTELVASSTGVSLPAIDWTSGHSDDDYEPMPDESLMLTGEEVAVELNAALHYRIADLYRFAYGSAAPEAILRRIAESEIRIVAAASSLDGMLSGRRSSFERTCLRRIRRTAGEYDLGIEVTDLNLLDIHPPKAVVPSYRDVADALEEKEQRINEAEAYYASKVLSAAGGRAVGLLSESSKTEKDGKPSSTGQVTEWSLDDALWKQLAGSLDEGQSMQSMLSGEAAATLLAARQDATARTESASGSAARFGSLLDVYQNPKHRRLTGLHLYLRVVAEALASRPLTIIDPKVSGRQHLLLVDPAELGGGQALQRMFSTEDER